MGVTGGDNAVMRDPTSGGHLSAPRTVDQFGRRPMATTETASAKTQVPHSGDTLDGPGPMKNAGAPPAVQTRTRP